MSVGLQLRDTKHHTYGEYLTWPDDVPCELISGGAWLREPSPLRRHQDMVGELFYQVRKALDGRPYRAYVAPVDVRLPRSTEDDALIDTVVQPDILVVSDRALLDERGIRGAPDWVVEVLSPATAIHDQTRKLAVYEQAGVPEYWLVHPDDRVLTVYHQQGGGFGRPVIQELRGETAVAAVPDLVIDWERVLARLM